MSDSQKSSSLPWYKDGLRFECTECGGCCTGAPGYVWVTEEEMESISQSLEMPVKYFKKRYTRLVNGRYALVEYKSKNYACAFLDGKRCKIYHQRPSQCRTFPWWNFNLKSEAAWKEAARSCEGINDEAALVPLEEIEKQRKKTMHNPSAPDS